MAQYVVNFLNLFQGIRKSVVMLALIAITSVFRAKGLIAPDNFEGILKSTVIAYFGANGIEHYTAMVKTHLESKTGLAKVVTEIETTPEKDG
jgi:hypothetical protein